MKAAFHALLLWVLIFNACAAQPARSCGHPNAVFINGINNSPSAAQMSNLAVRGVLEREVPGFADGGAEVNLAFNDSAKDLSALLDVVESLFQKGQSYSIRTEAVSLQIYGALNGRNEHLRDAPPGFLGDIQAAIQGLLGSALQLLTGGNARYLDTMLQVTQTTREALASGPGVFMVAHSQGSLFANDLWHLLDTHELTPGNPKRAASGGYFIAPAAASMYAPLVTGYVKARTDLLARLGIGLAGNTDLFLNDEEAASYGHLGDPWMNHGFESSYLNAKLAGKAGQPVASPPHARMYRQVSDGLKAGLEVLKVDCGETWTLPLANGDEFALRDPLLYRDAYFCSQIAAAVGDPLPVSREACLAAYAPTPAPVYDLQEAPLALNWNGVCHAAQGWLACSLEASPGRGEAESYEFAVVAQEASTPVTCAGGRFELRAASGAVQCLDWSAAMVRLAADD